MKSDAVKKGMQQHLRDRCLMHWELQKKNWKSR